MSKIAFVTGGSGFIGNYLIKDLVKRNYFVKALVRSEEKALEVLKLGCEPIIGDLRMPNVYKESLSDCNIVFHLGGVVTDWAPKKLYYDVNIGGTHNLLEIIKNRNIKRFVYISTIDVLNKFEKEILDEECVYTESNNPYCKTKAEADKLVFLYSKKYNINITVVRPAWVYGIGDTTLIPELYYQLKRNNMVYINSKDIILPIIHVQNLVEAIILSAESDKTINEALIISDGEITWGNLCEFIAKKFAFKLPKITIPYSVAYFIGWLMEVFYSFLKLKKRPLLTRTAVEMLGISIKLNTSKAKKLINYQSKISIKEGLNEVFEWIKNKSETLRLK